MQVSVTYLIEPGATFAFRAAMRAKRRLRLRDGARDWRLLQDIADPRCWTEQYVCGSWALFCRLRERRVDGDEAIERAVVACHAGNDPPAVVVRRMDGVERASQARVAPSPALAADSGLAIP